MSGLTYLIQANIYLILFMGFYALVLKNETFFRHNRIYLNASVILSFAIPFLNTSWFNDLFITERVREATQAPVQMMYDMVVVVADEENNWTMADTLLWIYIGVAGILFIRLIAQLLQLKKRLNVVSGGAFSFFNILVVDSSIAHKETIITHEKVHMKEWHSADVLLTELVSIIVWFNPVIYLYKTEIRHIHEFIADEEASSAMNSKTEYAELLFSATMGIQPNQLSNNFFNHSLLKRRIMMLYKSKSTRTALWKYGFSAPLFAGMLIFSAATARTGEPNLVAEVGNLVVPMIKDNLPESGITSLSSQESVVSSSLKNIQIVDKVKQDTTIEPKYYQLEEVLINSEKKADNPMAVLLTYMRLNLRYPPTAREQKTIGLVRARFTLSNKKIISSNIEKTQSDVLSAEVLRALKSFPGEIDLPNDSYAMSFVFMLLGADRTQIEKETPEDVPNHKGTVAVMGYIADSDKSEKTAVISDINTRTDGAKSNVATDIKDFASVEVLPEFAGGTKGWADYLKTNLKYPEIAKKNNITGRVIVSFIVEKDGDLSDIKVLRGIGGGADEEAVRVLKASPKWQPGLTNGEKVRVAYTMPIFFQLPKPAEETKDN